MAKIVIVGGFERKGSYCPQCRKKVPPENRLDTGIKCPRCGFFRWDDFKKYKPFIDIPEPTETDLTVIDEILASKENEKEKTPTEEAEDQSKIVKEKLGVDTEIVGKGTKRPVVKKAAKPKKDDSLVRPDQDPEGKAPWPLHESPSKEMKKDGNG